MQTKLEDESGRKLKLSVFVMFVPTVLALAGQHWDGITNFVGETYENAMVAPAGHQGNSK